MLQQLAADPATTQKRLGDGFYEQRLLGEQVASLTGRRFLAGYQSDEDQYRALMDAGVTVAQAWSLRPGVALFAAQVAQLTTDLVWLVEKEVTLADGTRTQALVPQLYARVQPGDLAPSGSLLSGEVLDIAAGEIKNIGTLAGRKLVSLTAENIHNLGGTIQGEAIALGAENDIEMRGGNIAAGSRLDLLAGRNIDIESATRSEGGRTHIERVAGLYVQNPDGQMRLAAAGDVTLLAAQLESAGTTRIDAGGNLTLGTVRTAYAEAVGGGKHARQESGSSEVGSVIQSAGDLTLIAGRDLTARAAGVNSDQGHVLAAAGNDLRIEAGERTLNVAEQHKYKSKGFLSSKKTVTRDSSEDTTALASTFSGDTVTLIADNDIAVKGSNVTATHDLIALAGRDVVIDTAQDTHSETHFKSEKKSGLSVSTMGAFSKSTGSLRQDDAGQRVTQVASTLSAGTLETRSGRDTRIEGSTVVADGEIALAAQRDLAILSAQNTADSQSRSRSTTSGFIGSWWQPAFGTVKQNQASDSRSTTQSVSQVASLSGNVNLNAGEDYTQKASDILAPQGDIDINARQMDILAATNSQRVTETREYKKTAIGGSVSVPLLNAAMSIANVGKAATQTSDPRMQALAAATVALQAKTVVDSAQALAAGSLGGIKVSVSLGTTKTESRSEQESQTVVGSTVAAGNDVRLNASGAGQDSDLTIQGSQASAGNNLTLSADDEIRLLAAANTARMKSDNSNSGASIGIGFAFGGAQNGWTLELGANTGRGKADGTDVAWTNTQVTAGNVLALHSGGDTTLKGAVASGQHVNATVGGNLNLTSLQDNSTYDGKQKSGGFGLSLCIPPFCYGASTGSVSAAGSEINSDYASVTEQTGIKAGDQGFQIAVSGNIDLTGAVIASTDTAVQESKNRLTTGGALSLSDIQNRADYDAKGYAVTLSASTKLGDQTSKAAQSTMTEADKAAAATKTSGLSPSALSGAGIGKDSGQASSTTLAGISGIAGNTSVRSGDAETGVAKIFDAGKVQKEINAQTQITQAFNQIAPQAAAEYATSQLTSLSKQIDSETDPEKKAALQDEAKKWAPNGTYNIAMNIIIGAAGGNLGSAVTKETLSWAANEMRQVMIEDSKKFKDICDTQGNCISNHSGQSVGVNGDNFKLAGGRIVLADWCADNRCTKDSTTKTGYKENSDGTVIFKPTDKSGNPITLTQFVEDNPQMSSPLGGHQGGQGQMDLFGIEFNYAKGSVWDKLAEAYAGTHDTLNSVIWYDKLGNGKDLNGTAIGVVGNVTNMTNVGLATPFALSVLLPPEVWSAIGGMMKIK